MVLAAAVACSDQSGPRVRETAAVSLVASDLSTCALTGNGTAFCWGGNTDGQLGIGDIDAVSHGVPVAVSGGHRFAALGGGGGLMCAATAEGQPWCWGETLIRHLLRDSVPAVVASAPSLTSISAGLTFSSVSVGLAHTCGLTGQGTAYCWGDDSFGALGNGSVTTAPQTTPTPVSGGLQFKSISAGAEYTCGITAAGKTYCWGFNPAGTLGDSTVADTAMPAAVAGGIAFSSIAATAANTVLGETCGLTSSGVAYCWGAGGAHVCGVTTGGAIYCWGGNDHGQLGNGTTNDSPLPQIVSGVTAP